MAAYLIGLLVSAASLSLFSCRSRHAVRTGARLEGLSWSLRAFGPAVFLGQSDRAGGGWATGPRGSRAVREPVQCSHADFAFIVAYALLGLVIVLFVKRPGGGCSPASAWQRWSVDVLENPWRSQSSEVRHRIRPRRTDQDQVAGGRRTPDHCGDRPGSPSSREI